MSTHSTNHEFCPASRREWRSWLSKNHTSADEIWLVYYKKHTGKPSIKYMDSVEEALCFGWIDGIKRKIDEERYVHRFTPRRSKSKWSETNVKLARKMIEEGKMTESGLVAFNQRLAYRDDFFEAKGVEEPVLPTEIQDALKVNKTVWDNFTRLAPGYRKQYILWLTTAKKAETREKRLKEAIELLAENKKLGMR